MASVGETTAVPWQGRVRGDEGSGARTEPPATDRWGWKIGRIAGIEIRVHATFGMLLAWLTLSHLMHGHGIRAALEGLVFILAVFGIVVLHELGHALMARRFGIRTRDITLLPIGGVARLERMPEKPSQELLVALAGPAVNIALALLFFVTLLLLRGPLDVSEMRVVDGSILTKLMWVNVSLALFNLVPAFPMDGGRVLRAVLAARMGRARATAAAAGLGRFLAIGFGLVGLFSNPMLIFIALFVWLGATQEGSLEQARALLDGVSVQRAMVTNFSALAPGDRLDRAIELVLAGFQQDFPIVDGDRPVGVLVRDDLLRGFAKQGGTALVSDWMRADFCIAGTSDPLEGVLARLEGDRCRTVLVVQDGKLVGLVTPDNVGELLMVEAARRTGQR